MVYVQAYSSMCFSYSLYCSIWNNYRKLCFRLGFCLIDWNRMWSFKSIWSFWEILMVVIHRFRNCGLILNWRGKETTISTSRTFKLHHCILQILLKILLHLELHTEPLTKWTEVSTLCDSLILTYFPEGVLTIWITSSKFSDMIRLEFV